MKYYKDIDWEKVLDPNLAYTAKEIASLLGMNIMTTRRYLRRARYTGRLVMRRKGRIQLYALPPAGRDDARSSRQKPASKAEK